MRAFGRRKGIIWEADQQAHLKEISKEIAVSHTAPSIVYVVYEGVATDRFDRRYYTEHHLPLVMQAWQRYGLERVCAFFPPHAAAGTLAICECRFRDDEAIEMAFGSSEASGVMADVQCFTDLLPTRHRIAPM